MYQRCINPARTGPCRAVRSVPGGADITPARALRNSRMRHRTRRADTVDFQLCKQGVAGSIPAVSTSKPLVDGQRSGRAVP